MHPRHCLDGSILASLPMHFSQVLADVGAFDAVRLGGSIGMPISGNQGVRASSAMIDGDADGSPALARAVGQIAVDPVTMTTRWPAAIVIVTDELLALHQPGSLTFLASELTRATVASTDIRFLAAMTEDAPTVEGSTDFLSDLSEALDEMEVDFSARLILIAPSQSVRHLGLAGEAVRAESCTTP